MIRDKLQKLSGRERGLLALAIVAILAALANVLIVQPTLVRFRELDREIDMKRVAREVNRVELRDELLIAEEYRAASALLRKPASAAEEIENMKERVGTLAGGAGVVLDSISHREPVKSGACDEYLIEISRYHARMVDILKFLHGLNVAEGMFRISKISIKPRKDSDVVEGSMAVTRVALGEDAETPAAE